MSVLAGLLGVVLIAAVLIEVFETIVLPRRVTRRLRLTRLLYRWVWRPWRNMAHRLPSSMRPEAVLSVFGPLAFLVLLALWCAGIIAGFAALQWANGSAVSAPEARPSFGTILYFSATTFFTLGLGDIVPHGGLARLLVALEAAGGFGVLALVIGYLPTLYQAFSRREVAVSLLDARAGSPPSAGELLRRYAAAGEWGSLDTYLADWEAWAAELMESHLSYPMLAFFRSQHDNQSWLAALTTILDACTFIIAALPEADGHTARLTFAMGRHAVADLAQVLGTAPRPAQPERLTAQDLAQLRATLQRSSLQLVDEATMAPKLSKLRSAYEPYVAAMSRHLSLPLPPWVPPRDVTENWRTTAWRTYDGQWVDE